MASRRYTLNAMLATFASLSLAVATVSGYTTDANYEWQNVKIGGGGGFVPDIIFNKGEQGLAFAR